jgi:hypothetical protein
LKDQQHNSLVPAQLQLLLGAAALQKQLLCTDLMASHHLVLQHFGMAVTVVGGRLHPTQQK